MKKLFLLLFMTVPLLISGQGNRFAALYTPSDNGMGVRYERVTKKGQGYYFTALYGNYEGPEYYIRDHWRCSAGMSKLNQNGNYMTAGLSVHKYGDHKGITNQAFSPVSLELGCGTEISIFNIGMIFDPLKWEGGFYVGLNF
ncbi:MAG: hypothetical protein JXA79_03955 [Deltaproteobacteria bacterium]|nr:hypothetical protein [Deltaproteobacteria bacterium]